MIMKVNEISDYLDRGTKCIYASHYFFYQDRHPKSFAIRIPGSTVGEVHLNDDNTIKEIRLGGGLVKYEPEFVKEVNDKFVGMVYDNTKDGDFKLGKVLRPSQTSEHKNAVFMSILTYLISKMEEEED